METSTRSAPTAPEVFTSTTCWPTSSTSSVKPRSTLRGGSWSRRCQLRHKPPDALRASPRLLDHNRVITGLGAPDDLLRTPHPVHVPSSAPEATFRVPGHDRLGSWGQYATTRVRSAKNRAEPPTDASRQILQKGFKPGSASPCVNPPRMGGNDSQSVQP